MTKSYHLLSSLSQKFFLLLKKSKEKTTIMLIPHSEKKIINLNLSVLNILVLILVITLTIATTSIIIIKHSTAVKEVAKLKKEGLDSKSRIKQFREEINKLYSLTQNLKPEISGLYSLLPENKADLLWAQGGGNKFSPPDLDLKNNQSLPSIETLNIKEIEQELKTTVEVLDQLKSFLRERNKIIENTPSLWPVEGYLTSRYGQRNSPYTFKPEFHQGIDIEAFPGSQIKASAPGKVVDIKWDLNLGLTISIKHKYGFTSSYSHCQRACVQIGQKVGKGELIGYVGKTGKTTSYLCYYQIKIGTQFIDPMPYLNKI